MRKFEYKKVVYGILSELNELNEFGEEGWELVSIFITSANNICCVFKKEKS